MKRNTWKIRLKENKRVKIPIETKKNNTRNENKKDEVNIYKAKWWESTVWDKTARFDLERVIKKEETPEKSKEIKKNLESEIREEFRNLLKNLKSLKWTKELDLKIEESISSVLKKYKETWAISDKQYENYKISLTKQFKEALYLKIKWKEIPEKLDWKKIGNKEFINRVFEKYAEVIKENKVLFESVKPNADDFVKRYKDNANIMNKVYQQTKKILNLILDFN